MYQLDLKDGESPDRATVKAAPSDPYVGPPEAVNSSEDPDVKSTETLLPSAGSAGHPTVVWSAWR